jgi:hypothetical protein
MLLKLCHILYFLTHIQTEVLLLIPPPPKTAGGTPLCRLPKIFPVSAVTGYAPVCVGSPRVAQPPFPHAQSLVMPLRGGVTEISQPPTGVRPFRILNSFFISLHEARQDPFRMIFPSLQHFRVDKYVSLLS